MVKKVRKKYLPLIIIKNKKHLFVINTLKKYAATIFTKSLIY